MAETSNIDKIIADLGANYKDDKEVLSEILEEVSSIASDISNRQKNDEKLFPYIKKATKAIPGSPLCLAKHYFFKISVCCCCSNDYTTFARKFHPLFAI